MTAWEGFPDPDDGTDGVRCECGRFVPCRHCPTPIDPADIRPGDVVEFRRRVNVTRVDPDGWIFENGLGFATGSVPRTWHLVSRPDPDAEAARLAADRPERISRDRATDDDWIDWTEEEP